MVSSAVEQTNKNEMKVTINVSPEKFEEGLKYSYNKNKGKLNIAGFRKGKVPRKVAEQIYGKEVFHEDAINHVLPEAYDDAISEHNLEPVSRPKINIESIDENGLVVTATITIKPEVKLGNYMGLTYKKTETTVTDEDVEREIDLIREKNSRIVNIYDRPLESGDISVIDFEGFVDGVAFEGGKGEDYELIIGSHTFIDTFEDQLIGLNVGDTKDVNVTFPSDYNSEELQGKDAMFKVELKEIKTKELPIVDDEFAQDVSEFDTLDEYKSNIRAKLLEKKEQEAKDESESRIIDALVDACEMDLPEVMVENECESMIRDFEQRIRMQGVTLDIYTQYTGMTREKMKEANREPARKRIQGRLALEAVAKVEDFVVSEKEVDDEVTRISKAYNIDKEKLFKSMKDEDIESLKVDIKVKKALDKIIEAAIAV